MLRWKPCKKYAFASLAALSQVWMAVEATCIHDSLPPGIITSNEQSYHESHPFIVNQRNRQLSAQGYYTTTTQDYDRAADTLSNDSAYRPIRITPYYDHSTLDLLDSAKRDVIFNVVPEAITHFQNTLQVIPVQGNLTAQHSCSKKWNTVPVVCGSFVENEVCFEMPIPQEHFGATRVCSSCPLDGCAEGDCTYSPSQGVSDSDYMLYVRSVSTSLCTGAVIAYAMACQKDQFDRPTFGMVNFCPDKLSAKPSEYDDQLTAALHELTHALGFSSLFFAYMRNQDGTPKTPRDVYGDPPIKTSSTCPSGKAVRYFVEPSSNVVEYSTERDRSVAKLVTPKVSAFVKQHFNCSSLTGAELESNDPGCIGSHWEERLFEAEYMSPVISFRNILSGLTLAYFEDSGWYKTNTSTAERLVFGANRGCEFATDKCINPNTAKSIAKDHYCTDNTVESCSVDATSRSVCTVQTGLTLPSIYQYFASSPTKGGPNPFADYCPLNVGYASGDCMVESNLASPPGTSINILGETYCPTCRCTSTTLKGVDSGDWLVNARRTTGCYRMECIWGPTSLEAIAVTVRRSNSGDSVVVNCTRKNEQIQVSGFDGLLSCPDPFIICGSEPPKPATAAISNGSSTSSSHSLSASNSGESTTSSDLSNSSVTEGSSSDSSSMEVSGASSYTSSDSESGSHSHSSSSSDLVSSGASSEGSPYPLNYDDAGVQPKPTSVSMSGSDSEQDNSQNQSMDSGDAGYSATQSCAGSSTGTISQGNQTATTTGSSHALNYGDAGVQPPPPREPTISSDTSSQSGNSDPSFDSGAQPTFPVSLSASGSTGGSSTSFPVERVDTRDVGSQGSGSSDISSPPLDYEDAGVQPPPVPLGSFSQSSAGSAIGFAGSRRSELSEGRFSILDYDDAGVQPPPHSSDSSSLIDTSTVEFVSSASGSETVTINTLGSSLDAPATQSAESSTSASSASEAATFHLRTHAPFSATNPSSLSSTQPTASPGVHESASPVPAPVPAASSSGSLDSSSAGRLAVFGSALAACASVLVLV